MVMLPSGSKALSTAKASSPVSQPAVHNTEGLATMSPAMENASNYYSWIAERVAPAVGHRVADVGGGRGSLLSHFLDRERLFAVDISPDAVAFMRANFRGQPHVVPLCADVNVRSTQERLRAEGVDSILCTNVLEHVEQDREMLASFHAVLAPVGGRLALLVPAHRWLHGSLDRLAGHFRRYTRGEVKTKLESVGFEVESLGYMNAAAMPGWFLAARVFRQGLADSSATAAQVLFYDRWILPITRAVESVLPPPCGLSVLALARATPAVAKCEA